LVNTVSASVGIAWDDDGLWRRFSERDTFGPWPLRGRGRGPGDSTQGIRATGAPQKTAAISRALALAVQSEIATLNSSLL
jgi:hypothetical protein